MIELKKNTRYLMNVLDRQDNKMKQLSLPPNVYWAIQKASESARPFQIPRLLAFLLRTFGYRIETEYLLGTTGVKEIPYAVERKWVLAKIPQKSTRL